MNDTDFMRKYANLLNENYRADMMDEFTRAYMEAILFAESDNSDEQGGEPLELNYDPTDFSAEALTRIKKDCDAFQQQAGLDQIQIGSTPDSSSVETRAGHDFWFTRAGHGTGFWDGDWPEPEATRLTELSEKFGNVDVYVGDDGQLELM